MKWPNALRAVVVLAGLSVALCPNLSWAQYASRPGYSVGTAGAACDGTNMLYGWPDANGNILKCVSNVWQAHGTTAAAGGSNGQVQFNSSGALSGSSSFVWDNTNGRVGIGTATPANLLTVYTPTTTGKVDVLDVVGNVGTGGNNYPRIRIDNVNAGSYKSALGFGNGAASPRWEVGIDANGSASQNFFIYDNAASSTRLYIDGSGNVGIGTTSPSYKLVVDNGSGELALFGANSTGPTYVAFGADSVNTVGRGFFGYDSNGGNTFVQGTLGKGIEFNVNNSSPPSGTAMVISSSGNVGIGTTTPSALLDIPGAWSNGNTIGQLALGSANNAGCLTLRRGSDGSQQGQFCYASPTEGNEIRIVANGGSGLMTFYTGGAERMRLSATGLVGIGTATPLNKLDVSGGSVIGAGYVGTTTAPANGLIVQGNVGIGSQATSYPLDIMTGATDNAHLALGEFSGKGPLFQVTQPGSSSGYLYFEPYGEITVFSATNSSNATLQIQNGGAGYSRLRFYGSSSNIISTNAGDLSITPTGNTLFTSGFVGIGTTAPLNKLDVSGGEVIGAGYIGTVTAPTNSLIAQGNVGIGVTSPTSALQVAGTIQASSAVDANAIYAVTYNYGYGAGSGNMHPDSGSKAFGLYADSASTILGLYMNTSGQIGIGTALPQATLDVHGSMFVESNNAGSSTAIDWSQGLTQYTSASCGAFTFTNMKDGGVYQLFIEGTTTGTCSFSQSGLTFKMPSNHGATTSGTMTVYSFSRAGSYVFVAWIPSY
ncbi:hypothetical protein Q3C01_28010 [Bradyrhizobium sp. UFLA05-109]